MSQTMNHFQAIEQCKEANSAGVRNLLDGKQDAAVKKFAHALQLVKRVLSELEEQKGESTFSEKGIILSPRNEDSHMPQDPEMMVVPLPARTSNSSHSGTSQPDGTCDVEQREALVYNIPLQITESAEFSSLQAAAGLSVAILFNLALSYHLFVLSNEARSNEHAILSRSVSLYETAFKLLVQEKVQIGSETAMAIMNNLGQIHVILGSEKKADSCFQQLLSMMCFVQSRGEVAETASDVFVESVSHLILAKNGLAAAA